MRILGTALLLLLGACGFWRDQFNASVVSDCLKKNCTDLDATAYTRCDAACRSTYGR